MDPVEALEATYAAARPVVAAVKPDDMDRPTPCEEWDVRAVLSHLVTVIDTFPVMLADGEPDWSRDALGDREPLVAFDDAVAANLAAWHQPGAADKDTTMMPGMKVIDINLIDAVVHTWDLAQGIGVDVDLPETAIEIALDRWGGGAADNARQYNVFGPQVAVGDASSARDRLLAMTGRTP
jgi:uncharacterized protein (TIGR03086 family)